MPPALSLAVMGTLSALWAAPAVAANPRPAWVAVDALIIRSGPGTDHDSLGTLNKGQKVYVIASRDGWCRASLPDGRRAWLCEQYLEFSADKGRKLAAQAQKKAGSSTPAPQPAWVKCAKCNVRTGPGTNYEKKGGLERGSKVYILSRRNGWCRVSSASEGRGWILGELLETNVEAGRKLAGKGTSPKTAAKAYVASPRVNLREGPGSRFSRITTLLKGQTLWVIGAEGYWRKVKVNNGPTGWVAHWLIKTDTGGKPPKVASRPQKGPVRAADAEAGDTIEELTAWIGADSANVRYGPGREYDVKDSLPPGTQVTVTDVQGQWLKVRLPNGKYGWVAGWVMNFQGPRDQAVAVEAGEKVNVRVGWVARPEVNIREGPGTEYPEVAEAVLGTELVILDQDGDWYKVALSNNKTGWMSARYIDTRAERLVRREKGVSVHTRYASRSRSGSRGSSRRRSRRVYDDGDIDTSSSIVRTARAYLGDRYVRGGSGPGGFDCSGLVAHVYRKHGVKLSRSSRGQFAEGVPVARDDLQPGDVVFFKNTYRSGISHVGIYVGGNKFIHASHPGGGVKITSLNNSYYARRYAGARRMR